MNIQLHNVTSDLSGTTGMAILSAILKGERNPKELAKLRDPRVKASEAEVARSLEGNWNESQLFVLRQQMDTYELYQPQIAECDLEVRKVHRSTFCVLVGALSGQSSQRGEGTEGEEPSGWSAWRPRRCGWQRCLCSGARAISARSSGVYGRREEYRKRSQQWRTN